jgi:hypothetical protein
MARAGRFLPTVDRGHHAGVAAVETRTRRRSHPLPDALDARLDGYRRRRCPRTNAERTLSREPTRCPGPARLAGHVKRADDVSERFHIRAADAGADFQVCDEGPAVSPEGQHLEIRLTAKGAGKVPAGHPGPAR